MSVSRNTIVEFCEEYLKTKDFKDFCHNGLQVEGSEEIDKIVTGVSLSQKLIEAAIEKNAQMIIVHHGIFKNSLDNIQIKGVLKNRLKLLLANNINVMGFHLPLDAHKEIGNNMSIAKLLDLKNVKYFNVGIYGEIGLIGELDEEIEFDDFLENLNKKLNTFSYSIQAGKKECKKISIISGGASPEFRDAAEQGADTYICGDVREEVVRAIEETEINFINAGHYNTEKLGVQNLGEVIAKEFKIDVEFVDVPNNI